MLVVKRLRYIIVLIAVVGFILPIFSQDTIPPVVRPHIPVDGAYSSCDFGYIVVYIYDESTIYRPSLLLTCWADGMIYSLPDSVVSILDTLFYFPYPDTFEHGTELVLQLAPVSDFFGNDAPQTDWSFTIDLEPPVVECLHPPPGTEIDESYPDLVFYVWDDLAGLSVDSSFITINGDTILFTSSGVTIEDSIVTVSLYDLDMPLRGGDSVFIEVHAADEAVLCGANKTIHICLYTVESGGPIRTLLYPFPNARVACPDTGIAIRIEDENGILEDSLRLIIDGVDTLFLGDMGLTFDGEILHLPTIPHGWHTYELIAYDILFNPLETPLVFDLLVDTEPPFITFFEPDTAELLTTLSPTIRFRLYDSLAGVNHSPTMVLLRTNSSTTSYTLSSPYLSLIGDTYELDFDGPISGLRGGDTLEICIISYDSITFCDPNGGYDCFTLVLPFTPPVCSLVTPPDGAIISCPTTEVRIVTYDDEGVYFPSLILNVNGVFYYPLSPNLRIAGDTIIFTPPEPWRHGERVNIEMTYIEDVLRSASDAEYSWTFRVDLEGPRMVSHTPRVDELVVDSMTSVNLVFRRDMSGIDSTTLVISVNDEMISYPDPRLLYSDRALTYTPVGGFSEVDTVEVCFIDGEDMPYPLCPPNSCETCPDCWTFFVDARAPFVSPPEGVISACDSQTTALVMWSPLGIIPSTIEFQVNDVIYTIDDDEIWFAHDTLHFGPPEPWEDGDTVRCLLIHANDGLTDFDSIAWTFYIDLTPPAYTSISPLPDEIISIPDPMIIFELHDSISGIDSVMFSFEVDGSHFDIYSTFIEIDDGVVTFDLSRALGGVCGGDTIIYCIFAPDNAYPDPYCGPNVLDTCLWFAVEYSPPIVELLYPDTIYHSSCSTVEGQQTRIFITDENGIDSSSYRITFNGEEIGLSDDRLSLIGDTLVFQPSEALPHGAEYNFTLHSVTDIICNTTAGFSFGFLIDNQPPYSELVYPLPRSITSDTEPDIQIIVNDSLSPFGYNLYLDGVPFDFDSMRGDTGFYRPRLEFDEEDSIIVCVSVWDTVGNCGFNTDSLCFFFLVDAVPPTVRALHPDSGSVSSCPADTILLLVQDISGIDPASIIVAVNGVSHGIASPRLRFINDTIIYVPAVPWEDGDTVVVDVINVSDVAGNSATAMGILSFIVDLSPPYIISNPADGDLVYSRTPGFAFMIFDDIAGVDTTSLGLSVGGLDFDYPGPEFSIIGDSIVFDMTETGLLFTAGDTVCFCVNAGDLAEYCGANIMDTCVCVILPDTPPELIGQFPEPDWIISCSDSSIHLHFDDDEGISTDSAIISIDGDLYYHYSAEMTISSDEIELATGFLEDGFHEVCIVHVEDNLGSVMDGLPLCFGFIVDTEPPTFITDPPIGDVISNPAPIITVTMSDPAGLEIDSIRVQDIVYNIADPAVTIIADTVIRFEPAVAGIDTLDTAMVTVCIYAHDLALGCGYNYLDSCYTFMINLSAPVLELIVPFDGAYSSCADQEIIAYIFDEQGVDTASINFNINGIDYGVDSPQLEYSDDTLRFNPLGNWDTDTINVAITAADVLGNEINPPYRFVFYIDTAPPFVYSVEPFDGEYFNPPPGAIIDRREPVFTFRIYDNLSGFDSTTAEFWIGDSLMIPSTSWDMFGDGVFSVNSFDEGIRFFERDTVHVSLRNLADMPDYCDPNVADDFDWYFIIGDDDTLPPEIYDFDNSVFCGDYFHFECSIFDTSGIYEAYALAWFDEGDTMMFPMVEIAEDRYRSIDSLRVVRTLYYQVYATDDDFDDELPEDRLTAVSDVQVVTCSDYELPLLPGASVEPRDTCVGDTLYFNLAFENVDEKPATVDSIVLNNGEYFLIVEHSVSVVETGDTLNIDFFFAPTEEVLYEDSVFIFVNGMIIPANSLLLSAHGLDCITEFSILPTPFTPNDDGYNDKLFIQIPGHGFKEIYFFDTRNVLRRTITGTDREFIWDGNDDSGRPCEAGSYIYYVKIDDEQYRTGVITLAR